MASPRTGGSSKSDLTVIYITANEVPDVWGAFQRATLVGAWGGKIITVARKPMDFGDIFVHDTEPKSYTNIYRQLLRAAKLADTEFVATAEDDTLYSKEHYLFRPKADEFAYNRARWSLFQWDGIYSLRQRVSNCSLIAPRKLLIEALEERFEKPRPDNLMGECGRNNIERAMGITERKMVEFWSGVPIVQLCHDNGTEDRARRHRKKHAEIKAIEIPHWGRGDIIASIYEDHHPYQRTVA